MDVLCIYFYVFFLYMYLFVHRCIFSLHVFISSPAYLFVYLFIYLFMYLCIYIYIHTIFVREVDESARDVILKALPAGSFCKCAAKSAA